ncbi:DEKNAAC100431 [Brettanomyces naardenensis]|uniref:2'-phosphotransferase n=1 Tax=Brettanomyces naardenensis TaxID=13370 RepID=A0A448YG48_BRENA|nr:DEKNAAC100431 [Brettanomyces naardenensis]
MGARPSYNEPTGVARLNILSRALSKLLRHQAGREHMSIDDRGFMTLDDVLSHRYFKSMKATPDDIFHAVNINDKKRFKIVEVSKNSKHEEEENEAVSYEPGCKYIICALQGHSISSVTNSYAMVELTGDNFPEQIIHGTYYSKLKLIKKSGGLSRMNRNHMHFAEGLPRYMDKRTMDEHSQVQSEVPDASIISGMRKNSDVIIYLDVDKVKKSNLVFYRSGNGVILSQGDENGLVSTDYFKRVTDMQGREIDMDVL